MGLGEPMTDADEPGILKMATEKQIAANQRNALMSTGPRSLTGKRRSAANAMRHGLTATQTMLPGEDEVEFSGLKSAMFRSLNPEGALENQLVERAASLIWRMRRIQAFEVALFQWTAHHQSQCFDDPADGDFEALRNEPFEDAPTPKSARRVDRRPDVRDALKCGSPSRLSRYETSMQRQLSLTLRDLREMQRPRYEARIAEAKAVEAKAISDAKMAAKGMRPSADSQYDRESDPAY